MLGTAGVIDGEKKKRGDVVRCLIAVDVTGRDLHLISRGNGGNSERIFGVIADRGEGDERDVVCTECVSVRTR